MLGTCDKGRGAPAQWPFGPTGTESWVQSPIGLVNPSIGGVLADVRDKENLLGGATFVGDEYVADFAKAHRMRSIRRNFDISVHDKIRAGDKTGISTFRFLDKNRFVKAMIAWTKGQKTVVDALDRVQGRFDEGKGPLLVDFLAVWIARIPRRYRGRYIRRWYRGLRSEAYQRWLPALYRLYQPGQRQEQKVKQEGSEGNHDEQPFKEEEDTSPEEVCDICLQGLRATTWDGTRWCAACWAEGPRFARTPGDRPRPPTLILPPDDWCPPELSENMKAVRVKFIQERDKIIAAWIAASSRNLDDKLMAEEERCAVPFGEQFVREKRIQLRDKIILERRRLDENYRLLHYFSASPGTWPNTLANTKKQIQANRERIEKYEEEEADFAEKEWAWQEDSCSSWSEAATA